MKDIIKTPFQSGVSTISERLFYLTLSLFVIAGLMTTYSATFFAPTTIGWPFLIIVGLVIPLVGVFVSQMDSLPVSFLGYNMITIPFGLLLGPVVDQYAPGVVQNASLLTALITAVMGTSGVLFPDFYKKIGTALFVALVSLLVVRILGLFFPQLQFGIIDYIAAGIFSLYIGYDMYRASQAKRTVLSALHIAVSLYLDIINLFMNRI